MEMTNTLKENAGDGDLDGEDVAPCPNRVCT